MCEVALTDEPVEFENYRLKFMASGNLPIFQEGFYRILLKSIKRSRKMSTYNWRDFRNVKISTDYAQ